MNEDEIVISSEVREAVACHQRILESGKLANEDIAEFSGLPIEVVKELANSLQNV